MKKKKNELNTNLISSFLILLSFCLAIALLINLRFHEDCATVIVGMLGVCAALYAPVAAFFLYDSWKDQHNATVYSNLALESLSNFKKLSYYLVSFKDLEINLNEVIKNNFMEQDKKLEAVINIYENYIENRQELSNLKSIFLNDIIFIAQLRDDSNLLSASLDISTKIQKQLNKLNEYIKNKNSTKLNNNELLKLISDDNTVFCKIGLDSGKTFLPLIQKYIQQ